MIIEKPEKLIGDKVCDSNPGKSQEHKMAENFDFTVSVRKLKGSLHGYKTIAGLLSDTNIIRITFSVLFIWLVY